MLIKKVSKLFTIVSLVIVLLSQSIPLPTAFAGAGDKVFDIVQIPDFHGTLVNGENRPVAAVLARNIEEIRSQNPDRTLVLGGGDNYQDKNLYDLIHGLTVMKVFNAMGMEASTVGNHEFDWGLDAVTKDVSSSNNFPLLAANLFYKNNNQRVLDAYKIFEKDGVKIAVIGAVTRDTQYALPGTVDAYNFEDIAVEVNKAAVAARAQGAQIVVANIHEENDDDTKGPIFDITKQLEGVDAVLGAHGHRDLKTVVNGIPLIIGRARGEDFVHMKISLSSDNKLSFDYNQIPIDTDSVVFPFGFRADHPVVNQAVQDIVADSIAQYPVLKDKSLLNLGNIETNEVTGNLVLPVTGANGTTISWESSNPAVIVTNGTVHRPAAGLGNAVVTLTATITKDGIKDTKQFAVTVLDYSTPRKVNVAKKAIMTASSEYNSDYPVKNVKDGKPIVMDQYEWASKGETKPWIKLEWPEAVKITKINMYDRPNIDENANGGLITFSDGSTMEVSNIDPGGKPTAFTFPAKTITSLKFEISGGAGSNVGLAELEVFGNEAAVSGKPQTDDARWVSGEFHAHTYLSDDAQESVASVLENAFDIYDLDWLATADHMRSSHRDDEGRELNKTIPRSQSITDYAIPKMDQSKELYKDKIMFPGFEWDIPNHEHGSVGIVTEDKDAAAKFEQMFGDQVIEKYKDLAKTNQTHEDAINGIKWLKNNYPDTSYFLVNHPSRKLKYTIKDFRDFNNAAPEVSFGFEGMLGNQMEGTRGGYDHNGDVQGRSYGGVDYKLAKVGGFWDAMLGEGRKFWVFGNSDFHFPNGSGYWPGEYAKNHTWVQGRDMKDIVNGMRSGKSFSVFGDLMNELDFTITNGASKEEMGGELLVRNGDSPKLTIRFKSPDKNNNGDPVKVDHIDLIAGGVTGKLVPGTADYENKDTNDTTKVIHTFTSKDWKVEDGWNVMTYDLGQVNANQYFRLRATNLAPNVENETDKDGNPLFDIALAEDTPAAKSARNYKDLWMYSNPIFVSVAKDIPRWMVGEFHNHSSLSDDADNSLTDLIHNAFDKYNLDWVATADHMRLSHRDDEGKEIGKQIPRSQSINDYAIPKLNKLSTQYKDKIMFPGFEWDVPSHEHASVGIITDDKEAVSKFEHMFTLQDIEKWTNAGLPKVNKTHEDAVKGIEWLKKNYADTSYFLINHPSRKLKYSISDFRDFNNAAPNISFGFEGMLGNQMEGGRGGYSSTADPQARSYGGVDYKLAQVGGFWDALLGEGRKFWVFGNSDFHAPDYWPGEYLKNYTWVKGTDMKAVLDGMRSGKSFSVFGDLMNALDFHITNGDNTKEMGEELQVKQGDNAKITIRFKSPENNNNGDVVKVHHIDLIAGEVTGKVESGTADYNKDTNDTTKVIHTFNSNDWKVEDGWNVMTYDLGKVSKNQYFRLRATNLAPSVENETDEYGNPLFDVALADNSYESKSARNYKDLWMYSNPIFVNVAKDVNVTGVTLDQNKVTMSVSGSVYALVATVNPDNATNKAVIWNSSNPAVATVDSHGVVTPVGAGTAMITVITAEGGFKATCEVTVNTLNVAVTGVKLNVNQLTMSVSGSVYGLVATVNPTDATNKTVTWRSSNTAVAKVDSHGVVTPVGAGTATITVITAGGFTAISEVNVLATNIAVTGVKLNDNQLTMSVSGSVYGLVATVNPTNATNQTVKWSSSNTAVAKVDSNGVVTPVGAGTATITVKTTDGGFIAICTVTVNSSSNPDDSPSTVPNDNTPKKEVNPISEKPGVLVVKASDISEHIGNGVATVTVSGDVKEIELPSNTAELLAQNQLKLEMGKVTLDIPSDLIQQLANKVSADELKVSKIVLKKEALSKSEEREIIAKGLAPNQDQIRVSGEIYELSLHIVTKEGKIFKLSKFDKAITIHLKSDPSMNQSLSAIYYIADDGKLEFIGGKNSNGEMVAEVYHFSKYAILELKRTFIDVLSTHWAADTIQILTSQHIVEGISEMNFEPERSVTRAEFVAMLVRSLNLKTKGEQKFSDVASNAWYADSVALAVKSGIVAGKSDTIFEPNARITRQEMVAMMMRAYTSINGTKPVGNTSSSFNDESTVAPWALEFVRAAAKLGLIQGRASGQFIPDGMTTRAEAAQVIHNLLQK
ncbi:immunoglobulin-like domain-containing protein [Paenibacillus alba]|uniref:Ig-like domain-containing protein n=1 Tax=Paenibacillus alba TaxID=1197127 RepID=A0ABU6FWJ6_9BACL|nr:S-layer homology domain-containing protein [Paenibacillus alba]MEC0226278.1 Ig-like domain-containing protein [Paenibacillus alba]